MLELIYIRDEDEAAGGTAKDLKMVERWRSAGASPFGLVFRPGSTADPPPFPGWPTQRISRRAIFISGKAPGAEGRVVMPHGFRSTAAD
jgi:hypothetical protein